MNSKEMVEKPVIAIRTGRMVGKIRFPLIDGFRQEVIGFIVDDEKWFLETKVIPFAFIRALDGDVVTVEDELSILPLMNLKGLQKQLEENIQLIGYKVITETGKVLGFIEDFSFNSSTGKLQSYKIKDTQYLIDQQDIISLSKELMIVKESVLEIPSVVGAEEVDLNTMFERRQIEFILGKRLLRDLKTEEDELIAQQGQIVSEEVIRRAKERNKFSELIMSVELF